MKLNPYRRSRALQATTCSLAATVAATMAVQTARADYASTVMGLNPIAYYQLNETTPVPVTDVATNYGSAGAVGNGVYGNSATHGVAGALVGSGDTAAGFNGYAARMQVPFSSTINPTGPFTAEAWVKPGTTSPTGGFGAVMSHCYFTGSVRYGWVLYQVGGGWDLRMNNGVNTANVVDLTVGGTPTAGQWYHLAVVYSGTNVVVYVNGVAAGSNSSVSAYKPNYGNPFTLGLRPDTTSYPFQGAIDEVALYTNALSANDILAHYQNGTSPTPSVSYDSLVQSSNPLLYYRLNETPPQVTAVNLGSLGGSANGAYEPGATNGVPGPQFGGFGAGNTAMSIGTVGDVIIPPQPINTNNFTITAWFKRTGTHVNGQALVFNRRNDQGVATGLGFGYNSPGSDQLNVHWNEGPSGWLTGLTPPNDTWCFAAAVYTPTNVTVYLDNLTNTYNTTLANHDFSQWPIYLGWDFPFARFSGSIDEVAMFDRALAPSEVQSLYGSSQMPPQVMSVTRSPADPVFDGTNITMTATVVGAPTLTYQWYKDSAPLTGKTNASLVISNVKSTDSGSYLVVAANAYGSATGAVQTITVTGSAPIIATQPASVTCYVGNLATLSVVANGSQPLTYQWSHGGTPIAGATSASLSLGNVDWIDAGSYSCTIANAYGTTNTTTATLTVAGQFAGTVLPDTGNRDRHTALGSDGTNLYFTRGNGAGAGFYKMREGSLTNWTTLASIPLPTTWGGDDGLGDLCYFGGALWTFARNNSGDGSSARAVYQYDIASDFWTAGSKFVGQDGPNSAIVVIDTTNIMGGWMGLGPTAAIKQITDWQNGIINTNNVGDAGGQFAHPWDACIGPDNVYFIKHNYTVDATPGVLVSVNKSGTPSVTNITGMPFNPGMGCAVEYMPASFFSDGHARLYILRGGSGSGSSNDGSNWTTASTANQLAVYDLVAGTWTLQTLPFAVGDGSEMALVNQTLYILAANSDTQPLKMLYLGTPVTPTIATQPVSKTIYVGQTATFSVNALGGGSFTYQWRRGGVNIPGANRSSFTVANAGFADTATYDVVVTNPAGTATSLTASLTVLPLPTFANLTNGLVVHLKFDGDINDASGNTNNATQFGMPTFVPGKLGQAIELSTDKTTGNNYLVLYDNNSQFEFTATNSFSIAFWLKFSTGFYDLPIIGNAGNSTYNPGYCLTENNNQFSYTLMGKDFGSVSADPVGGPLLNDGAWHQVTLVIDRNQQLALSFVDGALIDSRSIAGVGTFVTWNPLTIGQDPTGAYGVSGTFDMDDLGIWNRALAPTEAEAIYMVGQSKGQSYDTVAPMPLTVRKNGSALQLIWQAGTLEWADDLNGSWSAVPGATAPYFQPTPDAAKKFFRVRY